MFKFISRSRKIDLSLKMGNAKQNGYYVFRISSKALYHRHPMTHTNTQVALTTCTKSLYVCGVLSQRTTTPIQLSSHVTTHFNVVNTENFSAKAS